MLGSMLSDVDKTTFTHEMEEFQSIAELMEGIEEDN